MRERFVYWNDGHITRRCSTTALGPQSVPVPRLSSVKPTACRPLRPVSAALSTGTVAFVPIGGEMNRKNDTAVILDVAIEQHKLILAGYERALLNESLDLRVPVKNAMENLRSALDYMAHDIYEACCQPKQAASGQPDLKNIYFPFCGN